MAEELKFELEELKKQYPEIAGLIDPELLEFIISEKFLSDITQICQNNGVTDEKQIEKITYRAVLAIFGEVPKENLAQILELGADIESEKAKKIHLELNRLIFSQLKELEEIPEPIADTSLAMPEETEIKQRKTRRRDTYRESVE